MLNESICLSVQPRLPAFREILFSSSLEDSFFVSHGRSLKLVEKDSPTSVTRSIRPTTFDSGGSQCFPSVRQSFRSQHRPRPGTRHQRGGREVGGERWQGNPTGIRPTRVSTCTTIEFMTFWSHDWRCVERIPSILDSYGRDRPRNVSECCLV